MLTAIFCLGLNAQDKVILVIANEDLADPHCVSIVDAIEAADDITAVLTTYPLYKDVIADADAVIMTELPGSSTSATYTEWATKPTVSLKTYAMRADKGADWAWIENVPEQFKADKAGMDNTDVAGTTSITIAEDHDIFTGLGAVNDVFSFASEVVAGQEGEAHYQTTDFSLSPIADIAGAATMIGESAWEAGLADPGITGLVWAIDENASSMRAVVLGTHSQYVLSTEGLLLITNAAKWAAGLSFDDPIVDGVENVRNSGIEVFPNPIQDVLNIKNAASIININVVDITGKVLVNVQNDGLDLVNINTSNLVNGLYIVELETINGNVYTDKLVK